MTQSAEDEFNILLSSCRESAMHLEMRDQYAVDGEIEDFEDWKQGKRVDWEDRSAWWAPFHQAVADAVSNGAVVRRARVVSTPVTEYIRYEYEGTRANIAAGEEVRWLPRRQATDIALPGNDFWLFDGRVVRINHFDGAGRLIDEVNSEDPGLLGLCSSAFETVWDRATPHEAFHV